MIQPFYDKNLAYWRVAIFPPNETPLETEIVRFSFTYKHNDWKLSEPVYEQAKRVCQDYILALDIFRRNVTYFEPFRGLAD